MKRNRSSESGQFVSETTAKANPATTQSETVEQKPFRKYDIAMFSGETTKELAEDINKGLQFGYMPVTDVVTVQLSKLGDDIEDAYLQIFARKSK